jgi:hypothetical protein
VHITPAQRADIMPADPYAAEASAVKETVLVLTESMHLLSLTRQECVDSAIAVELPETFRSPAARRAEQRASNTLLTLLRNRWRLPRPGPPARRTCLTAAATTPCREVTAPPAKPRCLAGSLSKAFPSDNKNHATNT